MLWKETRALREPRPTRLGFDYVWLPYVYMGVARASPQEGA